MPTGITIPGIPDLPGTTLGVPSASPSARPSQAPASTPSAPGASGEAAVKPLAIAAASKEGLPAGLVLAVVSQESGFNARAVSAAGAQGLMQLMPTTVTHINQVGAVTVLDPFDAAQNLAGGCWYLKWVKGQVPAAKVAAGDEWRFALAGYNAGIGRVQGLINQALAGAPRDPKVRFDAIADKLPAETRRYVPAVWAKWDKYGR